MQEKEGSLEIDFPSELLAIIPKDKQEALTAVLKQDPRPQYQSDPERIYGLEFAGYDVRFKISDNLLTVVEIEKI